MSGLPHSSHALVTGGGRGIGREIASALARAGATVTVLGRNRKTLDDAVAAGDAHFAGVADVADQAAITAAIAEAAARQPIDILIANAGIAESAPFAKSDAALFRRMMDVDFMGVVHAVQAVLPAMKDRRYGRIVAVASTAGLKGYAYASAYSAAKHAVVGLVRSLALELASTRVTVNAVCPGLFDTELTHENASDDRLRTLQAAWPVPRLGRPEEVAALIGYLASEEAAYVTGASFDINGGTLMI